MCIRDSTDDAQRPRLGPFGRQMGVQQRVLNLVGQPLHLRRGDEAEGEVVDAVETAAQRLRAVGVGGQEACLLYTSDAGDERSSVDLGGRRVIKKKNTTRARKREKCKQKQS